MKENKQKLKNDNKKDKDNKQHDTFDWKKAGRTSFVWLSIIFGAIYISGLLTDAGKKEIEIEYTQYKNFLESGEIQKAVINILEECITIRCIRIVFQFNMNNFFEKIY